MNALTCPVSGSSPDQTLGSLDGGCDFLHTIGYAGLHRLRRRYKGLRICARQYESLRNPSSVICQFLELPMKGQNRVRQLHLDRSFALWLKVSDNGVQRFTWQGCPQSCTDFERAVQIELGRRIIPVGNICPESPRKLLGRVALDRILKLPGRFAHYSLRLSHLYAFVSSSPSMSFYAHNQRNRRGIFLGLCRLICGVVPGQAIAAAALHARAVLIVT